VPATALLRSGWSALCLALASVGQRHCHSAGIIDLIVWGIVALVVQLGGFLVTRLVLPHLPRAIEEGNHAAATFLAGSRCRWAFSMPRA